MTKIFDKLLAVGERLRAERDRLGLKQGQFAELGGSGRASQSNYERGESPFSIEYLVRLSEHGVDIGYVVSGVRSETLLLLDEQLLLDKYQSLRPAKRDIAHAIMSTLTDKPDEVQRAEANFWLASPPGSSSGTLHSPRIDYKAHPAEQTE